MNVRMTWIGWTALALFAAIAAYQLFGWPVVGMGDNGDFQRVLCVGPLTQDPPYAPGTPFTEQVGYVQLGYKILPGPGTLWYVSSELLILKVGMAVNSIVAKGPHFDVRVMGLMHVLLFLLAAGITLYAFHALPKLERWVATVAGLLIFTDVGYIAYFNSFYSESGTFVFLSLLTAIALALILLRPQPRTARWWLLAFLLAAVFFVTSKAQNVFLGLPLAALLHVLARVYMPDQPLLPVVNFRVLPAALLVLVTIAYFATGSPTEVRHCNVYHVVFLEMTNPAHSPDPAADLRALGLEPERYLPMAGTDWYTRQAEEFKKSPELVDEFFGRVSYASIGKFYLTHPGRMAALVSRHAKGAFLLRPPQYGNFPRLPGIEPGARSNAFSMWSGLKARFIANAPDAQPGQWGRVPAAPLFIGFLLVNLIALGFKLAGSDREPWQRMISVLHLCLVVMAGMEFMMVVLGDAGYEDTMIKHMYLTNQLLDLCVVFLLVELAAAIRALFLQWRTRKPAFRAVTEDMDYTADV